VLLAIQRAMDGYAVRQMGDHQLRDPLDHLEAVGFEVELARRARLGIVERVVALRPIR
jgi:hypothetical protein